MTFSSSGVTSEDVTLNFTTVAPRARKHTKQKVFFLLISWFWFLQLILNHPITKLWIYTIVQHEFILFSEIYVCCYNFFISLCLGSQGHRNSGCFLTLMEEILSHEWMMNRMKKWLDRPLWPPSGLPSANCQEGSWWCCSCSASANRKFTWAQTGLTPEQNHED